MSPESVVAAMAGGYHGMYENIPQRAKPEGARPGRMPLHLEGYCMEISDWRKRIDELDEQIVRLISQRAEAAQAIGEIKKTAELPVYEPRREQAVFEHVRAVNPGPLDDAEMLHVYERIIDVMRTLQRRNH